MKRNKQELLTYAVLWTVLFLAPVLSQYVGSARTEGMAFSWTDVLFVWRQFALFFVAFLIHNFVLAPLLVERQRRWLYFSLVAMLLAVFTIVQCAQQPGKPDMKPADEMADHRPPRHPDRQVPPEALGDRGPHDDRMQPPDMADREPSNQPDHEPHADGPKEERPPLMMGQHDVVSVIILILMLGMNVGVKLSFRQRDDRRKLATLEKQSLEQQLEYLKYQINPHFLMNTLNNIHALIDINAEQAKDSIIQLSKIMRFVLYEGSKQTVPLGRELAFTRDYIDLMRMRVTDRVRISVEMPERVPDSQIPPLMLITFVENAFKHGVSYRQESFIEVSVATDDDNRLHFSCRNSKIPQADDQHGGVGLLNVKQRLELIYGDRYTLNIDDQPSAYNIELTIPL